MRSFPPELTAKVKQSLQTLGNVSQPKLKIAVSRAKTTVTDSNYWTVETIREKAGLGDVSVAPRRLYKNYGGPDRLYEIHVDNGEVLTSLREYPDKLKQGWQPQFSLGAGSAVAIAFDGEWELYRKAWRLKTHEVPWIFWVDSLGDLYTQLWDDEETRVQLASGVDGSKGVKAIRGWKELNQGQNDQGLVIAYVKMEGTVAYRSYCIQSDLTYIWEYERAVTGFTGLAESVGLFLTNDYRLGVMIATSLGDIWWLITHRTWVGMATSPEYFGVGFTDFIIETQEVLYIDNDVYSENISTTFSDFEINFCPYPYTQPAPVSGKRVNNNTLKVTFSQPVLNIQESFIGFSVTNYTLVSISQGSNDSELLFTILENLPSVGVFKVNYTKVNGGLASQIDQKCLIYLDSFSVDAVGDPPNVLEYVNISFTDFIINMQLVNYINAQSNNENINIGFTDFVITFTKVNDNPV